MPQATPELREEWGVDERLAVEWLEARGYRRTPQWSWIVPINVEPTEKDFRAIDFLIQEWDFGGLAAPYATPEPARGRRVASEETLPSHHVALAIAPSVHNLGVADRSSGARSVRRGWWDVAGRH